MTDQQLTYRQNGEKKEQAAAGLLFGIDQLRPVLRPAAVEINASEQPSPE